MTEHYLYVMVMTSHGKTLAIADEQWNDLMDRIDNGTLTLAFDLFDHDCLCEHGHDYYDGEY